MEKSLIIFPEGPAHNDPFVSLIKHNYLACSINFYCMFKINKKVFITCHNLFSLFESNEGHITVPYAFLTAVMNYSSLQIVRG